MSNDAGLLARTGRRRPLWLRSLDWKLFASVAAALFLAIVLTVVLQRGRYLDAQVRQSERLGSTVRDLSGTVAEQSAAIDRLNRDSTARSRAAMRERRQLLATVRAQNRVLREHGIEVPVIPPSPPRPAAGPPRPPRPPGPTPQPSPNPSPPCLPLPLTIPGVCIPPPG